MIQTKITKDIYHGDGTTRRFEVTFDYNTKDNIKQIDLYTCTYTTEEGVIKYNNDVTKITNNYDFEVVNDVTYAVYPSDAAVSDGATPMAAGTAIIIMRATPNEQLSTGPYNSLKVEQQLDRITMVQQELQEQLNRAYQAPEYVDKVNKADFATVANDIDAVNTVAAITEDIDLVNANAENITTVAQNIEDVNTTGQNIEDVNTVALNISDVSTVAGVSSDVTQVASISNAVQIVSNSNSEVLLVADNLANVNTVANSISDVQTVAGIAPDVPTVASNAADISTVADNINDVKEVADNVDDVIAAADAVELVLPHITEINTVSDNISDVVTVAGISADVSTVASNSSNVSTVASNSSNITAVAGNSTNINTVAGKATEITTVANNISAVNNVSTNMTSITNVASDLSNIDSAVTNMAAIIAAPTAAQNAATSESNAQKWAEGTDAQVQPLGGTKSSKGWANRAQELVESIGTVMRYKGSVANYAALQAIQNPTLGDTYNVLDTGANYAWDGTNWDEIGSAVDLSAYRTSAAQDVIDAGKQETLVSGTNIKTINNNSLLGSGDLTIQATASWGSITGDLEDQTDLQNELDSKAPAVLLSHFWSDHIINEMSYLRGDTFSWQSGNVYTAAYNHLTNDLYKDFLFDFRKNTDYYVYGSPTIQNGIVSGITDKQNTVGTASAISLTDNDSLEIKLKLLNTGNSSCGLFDTITSIDSKCTLGYYGGISWKANYNESTSNTVNMPLTTFDWRNRDVLYIKLSCSHKGSDGYTTYSISVSTDDISWTTVSATANYRIQNLSLRFGSSGNDFSYGSAVNYSIDLNESYVKKNTAQTETIGNYTITYYEADDTHKICLADQEPTIYNLFNTTGNARYFILDTANTRFKLPRWKHNKYQAKAPVIGTGIALGFTNGQVNFGTMAGSNGLDTYQGDYGKEVGTSYSGTRTTSGKVCGIVTDPTKSGIEAILDTDDMYLYFYVGTFTKTAYQETAGLNSELFNNKADNNLSNVTGTSGFRKLISANKSGNAWYKVYAEYDPSTGTFLGNWCEQGDTVTRAAAAAQTITFPLPFADTSYTLIQNYQGDTANGNTGEFENGYYAKTTTGFTKKSTKALTYITGFAYVAYGYI